MIWIDVLTKAVLNTSSIIKKYYGNSKSLNIIGAGGDIIEEIDKKVEDKIISFLKNTKKSFNLISEEVGEISFGSNSSDYIILDPIDGSTNATNGIPFFCVSIAHYDEKNSGNLKNAVIYNWITGDIYKATKNLGAWKNKDKIFCSNRKNLGEAVVAYDVDPSNFTDDCLNLKKIALNCNKMRHMGSAALELALVAEGAFDAYIDLRKKLRIVDFAAGSLLVQEAGGEIFNELGKKINIPLKVTSRSSVCASNSLLSEPIKQILLEK